MRRVQRPSLVPCGTKQPNRASSLPRTRARAAHQNRALMPNRDQRGIEQNPQARPAAPEHCPWPRAPSAAPQRRKIQPAPAAGTDGFCGSTARQMDERGSSSHRFIDLCRTRSDRFAIISRYPRKPTPWLRRRSGYAAATRRHAGDTITARVSCGSLSRPVMPHSRPCRYGGKPALLAGVLEVSGVSAPRVCG